MIVLIIHVCGSINNYDCDIFHRKTEEHEITVDQEDPIYELTESLTPYKLIH